ncbi:hypothetical protein niasHS_001871 [Heterodera schachtii]|uniref:Uncharacterized protein n=1 Tax=Heterodera schachtii TaxID=97005 RepID=A0ABD2KAJ7_HETSC
MDESNGLNMKEIYEKILKEFDNRRHNQYSAERSFGMACLTEFFKLHSLNYLSQFVLRQIVQSALTSEANCMYKIFQAEMKHLHEELHIFLREHFGTVVGQIGISSREKGKDEIGDGETDKDEEVTTGRVTRTATGMSSRSNSKTKQCQHKHQGIMTNTSAMTMAMDTVQPREQCQDELKLPKQIGEAELREQQVGAVTEPTEAAAAADNGETVMVVAEKLTNLCNMATITTKLETMEEMRTHPTNWGRKCQ